MTMTLRLRQAGLLLGAALVAAGVGTVLLVQLRGWSGLAALGFCLPLSVLMASVLPSAAAISRSWSLSRRGLGAGLPMWAASALLVGLLFAGLARLGLHLLQLAPQLGAGVITTAGMLSGLVYLLALMLADVLNTRARWQEAQRRHEQSMDRAREAELLMLRTQIQPHFLFNCLNSISALTHMDPTAAREMTLQLAQYFRQTLVLTQSRTVRLADEWAHGRCYLDIEQVRFGDRLQVVFEAETPALQVLLPPMLLQPLLENALKHGVADSLDGGWVHVTAARHQGWLHVRIDNSLPQDASIAPAGQRPAGTGTGLNNVRQRLLGLYGARAHLNLQQHADRFVVDLSLPWRTSPHDFDTPQGPDH